MAVRRPIAGSVLHFSRRAHEQRSVGGCLVGANGSPSLGQDAAPRCKRQVQMPCVGWLLACTLAMAALVVLPGSRTWADQPPRTRPIDVWIDVDTATGFSDVDDGLMLIQCFHSPELRIHGISVVFGNTTLERAVPIARDITKRFGPPGLGVFPGAAGPDSLGADTPAVQALFAALQKTPLTILAVGPVTNVATLLKRHPEASQRIRRIVMVAGRRPGQRFEGGEKQRLPHRDFNFEKDPAAMQVILDCSIPLVFAPWEVSSQVWITRDDLRWLRTTGESGRWIASTSEYWISMWEKRITSRGFNPFDTLAAAWLTHPQWVRSMRVRAWIERGPDDRVLPGHKGPPPTKPYLLVEPCDDNDREILYCYEPKPGLKQLILRRLAGCDASDADTVAPAASDLPDESDAPAVPHDQRAAAESDG